MVYKMKDKKFDHIELADNAQVHKNKIDNRFNYEPMLNIHPDKTNSIQTTFLRNSWKETCPSPSTSTIAIIVSISSSKAGEG